MDTKPLELEAESLIQHELIKHGFNVTKPTFDKEGADLIIIDELKSKFTKSLRIQCKGRNLNGKSARVEIPVSYVDENFVVFVYLKSKGIGSELYVFFHDEIMYRIAPYKRTDITCIRAAFQQELRIRDGC